MSQIHKNFQIHKFAFKRMSGSSIDPIIVREDEEEEAIPQQAEEDNPEAGLVQLRGDSSAEYTSENAPAGCLSGCDASGYSSQNSEPMYYRCMCCGHCVYTATQCRCGVNSLPPMNWWCYNPDVENDKPYNEFEIHQLLWNTRK